ncbi:sugar phosphate isomerase/epimerase family protein [Ulvibacterium sp.]|uniref:sugar phosphate isomerase/epimerase family protein n=1 Tax=Ulvibacterium sp. TaxID=2665914 RepID=UPI003BA92E6E
MKRNDFIKQFGLLSAAGALGMEQLIAHSFTKPIMDTMDKIGIQLFSLPALLEKDFKGGIQMLSKMGYTELELFGPYPYSSESAKAGWKAAEAFLGFSGSGYFGLSEQEVRGLLKDHDMNIPSMHTDLDTLENHIEAFGKAKEVLGFEYITLPAIPDDRRKSMDDYKKMADTFNTIGENAKKLGLKFAYHNHGYGLNEVGGQIPFQVMMEATDPDLVFLEMDIFWTIAGRANPMEYLKKYSGRYHLLHIKDMKPLTHFSGDGSDMQQWMELFPLMTNVGDGEMDINGIIKTAKENGAKHFFVEQDLVQDPKTALKRSIDYLKTV